jgi:hypothetical protein
MAVYRRFPVALDRGKVVNGRACRPVAFEVSEYVVVVTEITSSVTHHHLGVSN